MTTLENRPNTALLVVDVQNGVVEGVHERDAVVANVGSLVEKARQEDVPVVWVQHSDDGLPRGDDKWRIVPELAPDAADPLVEKSYGDAFEDTTSRPCCRTSESGDSSWWAHRPMRASDRRCTARSSEGTTRRLSVTRTRRRTRRHGVRRRPTR
jgi:Isochorismatase family